MEKTENEKQKTSPLLRQCFVSGAICCNLISQATVIGYPAILLPQLRDPDSPIKTTPTSESWITSVLAISLLIGNFISSPIMSRYGRKTAHFSLAVPLFLGSFAIIFAQNVIMIIIGRTFQGLSFGMVLPLRSALIGEYTSPKYRGALLTTLSLSQTFGIFFVHLIGSFLHWKTTVLISLSFSIVGVLMTIFSPESPSFLASKGKFDECRKSFHWLRGYGEDKELNEMIEAHIILEKYKIEDLSRPGCHKIQNALETLTKKEFYKPIFLMSLIFLIGQFSGGPILSNYSVEILGDLLEPGSNVKFWMVALDVLRLICNVIAVFIINKAKRRTILFSVGFLSVAAHVLISLYVYLRSADKLIYEASWIPEVLICILVLALGLGMIPIPMVLAGEVYPLEYRSIAGSISVAFQSLWMFINLKTFPALVNNGGLERTYAIYSGVLALSFIIVWFMLPETKGKTLQEIEDYFRGRPLNHVEVEQRLSLQADPVATYKRTMSSRKLSSVSALC